MSVVRRLSCVSLPLVWLVVGCGSEVESTEYLAENRGAFLAACIADDDSSLVRDLCECTYKEVTRTIDHAEFVALEESLRVDTLTELPDTITSLMAQCFVEEVDL